MFEMLRTAPYLKRYLIQRHAFKTQPLRTQQQQSLKGWGGGGGGHTKHFWHIKWPHALVSKRRVQTPAEAALATASSSAALVC